MLSVALTWQTIVAVATPGRAVGWTVTVKVLSLYIASGEAYAFEGASSLRDSVA